MTQKVHRQDDIDYVEYYLRKTIQPNSLRSPKGGNIKSRQQCLDPKKNFVLFLNKQTALLREGQKKPTSIRDLYSKNQHSKEVILFPNFVSSPKVTPNHRRLMSLQNNDPLIKSIIENLDEDKPKDFIYAETPALNQKKQVVKETKTEPLSVEKKIKFAILDQIDEKDLQKLFKKFVDNTALEKLKDFRKDRVTKSFPMSTFYTALPDPEEEPQTTEQEKINSLLGHNSTLNTYIRNKLDRTQENRENKVIKRLCEKYDLNTERLLKIDENVGSEQKNMPVMSLTSLTDLKLDYKSDDIEKAQEELAQKARAYKDYQEKTKFKTNTFYRHESKANLIGDKRTIQRLRTINWEFIKGKGPESYQRKRTVIKELKHLQDGRFEIIDTLNDLARDRDRLKPENQYDIPNINFDKLDRHLEQIDLINAGLFTPEKPSTVRNTTRDVSSTINSPRGHPNHRRTYSNFEFPKSPNSPASNARRSVASIHSGNSQIHSPVNSQLKVEPPSIIKSPSNVKLNEITEANNSGQISTKAYDSKYFTSRTGSQKNSEIKTMIDNWNEFCEKIKMISEIQKKDSDYLHQTIPKFSEHVQKVYDKISELQLHEVEPENKEFNTFKDEKRFKNKLIECMMSKIKNKHAFVNVLSNRQRELQEQAEVEEYLEYNFDIKTPTNSKSRKNSDFKSPKGFSKKIRTPSLP